MFYTDQVTITTPDPLSPQALSITGRTAIISSTQIVRIRVYIPRGSSLVEQTVSGDVFIISLNASCLEERTFYNRTPPQHIVFYTGEFYFACLVNDYLVITTASPKLLLELPVTKAELEQINRSTTR